MATRPNILIFMTDHGQAEVFSDAHPALTPNASRLAGEGVEFAEAYCPSPHCCPSRATFMTGVLPSRHGVFNNVSNSSALSRSLNPGVATFGELLRAGSYRLAYCGKWHVSDVEGPGDRGFEERLVTSGKGASGPPMEERWWREGATPPAERAPGEILRPGWGTYRLYGASEDLGGGEPADERVLATALDALDDLTAGADPWCLFVGPIGPHDPYIVPRRYRDRYRLEDVALPASFGDDLRDKPNVYRRMREQCWGQLSEEEVRDAVRHYWAYCTYEDELLGRLLERLEQRGGAEDTMVVLTSDHGDYAGSHGLFLKGVPAFREAYNVPAIVRWPAGIAEPGRRVDALVSLADFAPTFLELAGSKGALGDTTGRSLVPFFAPQSEPEWRQSLLFQLNGVELYYSQRILVTADWKLVYNGFDFDELYDRSADPLEMRNLAGEAGHEQELAQLSSLMWRSAEAEDDMWIFNRYATVALARHGPLPH